MQWLGIFALMAALVAPSVALAQDASPEAGGGGVLVGAFDVGPGGCPECANPLQAGAGFTWFEVLLEADALFLRLRRSGRTGRELGDQ
ncbi:MAG: hypothetical protein R2848_15955 [Thermomicrobiales bacterium]